MVRVIDQHPWLNPFAFSVTPDYPALDYLSTAYPHGVYIYLATPLPLPLCSIQPPSLAS